MAPWTEKLTRISKASQALGSLRNRVLSAQNICLSTKLKVFNAVVLPSFHYGFETWTLYRRHIKELELFHMRVLRSILGIRWQDHITNLKVLDQAKSTSIEATIIKAHLRWVGHVLRMKECRMPRRLMYGELQAGKRKVDQNCGIKTRSKPISGGATSIRETGGICHGQTKMARLGSQSCCQLRRGSMPETHCCQREIPQSSLGSDHIN